jgi:hypothetical protein
VCHAHMCAAQKCAIVCFYDHHVHMCAVAKVSNGMLLVVVERLSIYWFYSIKHSLMWWFDLSNPGLSIPGLWCNRLYCPTHFNLCTHIVTKQALVNE